MGKDPDTIRREIEETAASAAGTMQEQAEESAQAVKETAQRPTQTVEEESLTWSASRPEGPAGADKPPSNRKGPAGGDKRPTR